MKPELIAPHTFEERPRLHALSRTAALERIAATPRVMNMSELAAMDEAALLKCDVEHLTNFIWRTAFSPDWADAAPSCHCGVKMQRLRVPYANSGTTRVAFACPEANVYEEGTGHQWAVSTSPEHYLDTNGGECCGGFIDSMEVCG